MTKNNIRNIALRIFDDVESMQRKAEEHCDPLKEGYICDDDIVSEVEKWLNFLIEEEGL